MTRAGMADPESIDIGGSEVPSTPVPPPNPRASSTSLPNVATLEPHEELIALADYCRDGGGILEVFKRMRKRTHGAFAAIQGTNRNIAEIRRDLGELPSPLKPDSGSGALLMLTKQDKKLTEIEGAVVAIRDELRMDREARKRAAADAEKAEKTAKEAAREARAPWSRLGWTAATVAVSVVVTALLGGFGAFIATHWVASPPPTTPASSGH